MKIYQKVALIIVTLQAITAFAGPAKPAQVEEYLAISGADQFLNTLPDQLIAGAAQLPLFSEENEQEQRIGKIVAETLDADALRAVVVRYLLANSTEKEMADILVISRSPLFRRFAAAQMVAAEPNFDSQLLRYFADLKESPPSPERRATVLRLTEAMQAVDMVIELMKQVFGSMFTAFQQANDGPDEDMLAEAISELELAVRPTMQQQMVLMSYYLYREFTDQELLELSIYYESPLGLRELALNQGAIGAALEDWAQRAAVAIQRMEVSGGEVQRP